MPTSRFFKKIEDIKNAVFANFSSNPIQNDHNQRRKNAQIKIILSFDSLLLHNPKLVS